LAGNSISTEAAKGWGASPFRPLGSFHILSQEDASHIRSHDPQDNRNPYHAQRQLHANEVFFIHGDARGHKLLQQELERTAHLELDLAGLDPQSPVDNRHAFPVDKLKQNRQSQGAKADLGQNIHKMIST
jgi:hypothetical protein